MIIADTHRFAFIHIPKCAGVSVKAPLRAIDSTEGFFSRIGEHDDLGRIHFAHITLNDLAVYFPADYERVVVYRSFAVVRDPRARFLSALFQRLREFKHLNQSALTARCIDEEAEGVIRYLESAPARLDLEHVHFNRQADYLFRDGQQIVRDVFAIENMAAVIAYITEHTEVVVAEPEKRNASTQIKSGILKPIVRLARAPYGMLVPYRVRNRIRAKMEWAGLYGAAEREAFIRPGGRIEGFVKRYYAHDVELHAASLER